MDQGNEGFFSPILRKARVQKSKPLLYGRVFDFGCGSGSLAEYVVPSLYFGFDRDGVTLAAARSANPDHTFSAVMPEGQFQTVVLLAVIEHVANPVSLMSDLSRYLDKSDPKSRIVLTTPHPKFDFLLHLGAKFGLFSSHAMGEHQELLDQRRLEAASGQAGLEMLSYKRFLLGANQIATFGLG
jgi:2-polyprenyl-3-methyl-5-hydroxy-6-metoxy-1,4-benzoquinol methylase